MPFSCTETARGLLDSILHRVSTHEWWVHAATIMPDHAHLVLSFQREVAAVKSLRNWRHWTARAFGFRWQRDFFEHRLRSEESLEEKINYLLQNPVRAGLVEEWSEWPFTILPARMGHDL
jgi:REP element-mobilizing transposase RayT